jgi:dTDP-4-amino-4,6-dideoxygalactose transaminase
MDLLRPELPKLASLSPYLQRIDESGVYSNYGPLHAEFKESLRSWICDRSNSPDFDVALTSTGTNAIELALRLESLPEKKLCAMPSYTFIATAHAVKNAGQEPLLLDVDERSLALTPEIVEALRPEILDKIACVIVVSVFGAPVDLASWESFKLRTGIPVVVDYAAGITSISQASTLPLCISLHATKVLGIGEGGAIISADKVKIKQWTAMTGFGFAPNSRESLLLGGNYRLDEYRCAVALATLNEIDKKIDKLFSVAQQYSDLLRPTSFGFMEGFGKEWISNSLNVIFGSDEDVRNSKEQLEAAGIPWRQWWGMGTHTHPAFQDSMRQNLETTEKMAPRVIGLPFHSKLALPDILTVRTALSQT